jgi:hypothetical protein
LVLEGEGYVLVTLAGVDMWISRLKPSWMFEEEKFSRLDNLSKERYQKLGHIYVLAVLFVHLAIVETMTSTFVS